MILTCSTSSFFNTSENVWPLRRRFDLNLGEEAVPPSPNNIWRTSFTSSTGPLTVGDSVMKNNMTAVVVARNLVTPKDNRLLAKRSDELAVKDSLALSVQCAGSVSNMAQRLFARTRQVESLAAEVMSLKSEIRGLTHENKQLHRLAHNYATNMKRKIDQMQESNGDVPMCCNEVAALSTNAQGLLSVRIRALRGVVVHSLLFTPIPPRWWFEEIRGLKHENKQLHKLAHNYATNMKRKIDQMQETDGQILLDHRRFVGLFQQHLPSSSGAVPRSEAPNDQPPIPPPYVAPLTAKAPMTTETSPK
ncbi:unnamed protein product [Malus baccata var. baccata]